jgi:hypothetical protein
MMAHYTFTDSRLPLLQVLSYNFFIDITPLMLDIHLATLTHAFLYFRKQIWTQSHRALHEQPDIHAHLMSGYPQDKHHHDIFQFFPQLMMYGSSQVVVPPHFLEHICFGHYQY